MKLPWGHVKFDDHNQAHPNTGMVFEVETPYYEFGFGGAFIEDTVVVTDTGVKALTELDRELQVISV